MSLFQCEHCGCCENTACACQGCKGFPERFFDWAGFEARRGKMLCSACAPTKHTDGTPSGMGQWHDEFPRTFLPMGMFKTNRGGDLEHIETGSTDFSSYAIQPQQAPDLSDTSTHDLAGLMLVCSMSSDPSDKAFAKACRDELARRNPTKPTTTETNP